MTIKLYEQDAYMREFTATVLSCEECENGYAVVLDQTAFFPEGGGQPADNGTLSCAAVTDVQIKDGIITHTVTRPLTIGELVTGTLNWRRRFDFMQNHTGEHIVAGLINSKFGYDNVGFHLNEQTVTLDVNGLLTAADILDVEVDANKAIYDNRSVTARILRPTEASTATYRSKLELTEYVRLIEIDGVDICACCAPHVARTGEIGVIKVIDHIPYKGGTRITLISGRRALFDYTALHAEERKIMRMLSAPRGDTAAFVKQLQETAAALRAENTRLTSELAAARLQTEQIGDVLCGFTSGASFDALRACAEQHGDPDRLTALFSVDTDHVSYLLYFPNGDVRNTAKALNAAFSGKGGGKPQYAQGKITATNEDILEFFKE